MADIKYSDLQELQSGDLLGTELVSLSFDTANSPGSEVWEDRAITIDELKTWIETP